MSLFFLHNSIHVLPKSEIACLQPPSSMVVHCTDQFVSDLIGNPEARFSYELKQVIRMFQKHSICSPVARSAGNINIWSHWVTSVTYKKDIKGINCMFVSFLLSLLETQFTTGLGKCRHLCVKSMPLAFTGIFRNNPAYFGIFKKQFLTDTNLVQSSCIYRNKLLKLLQSYSMHFLSSKTLKHYIVIFRNVEILNHVVLTHRKSETFWMF